MAWLLALAVGSAMLRFHCWLSCMAWLGNWLWLLAWLLASFVGSAMLRFRCWLSCMAWLCLALAVWLGYWLQLLAWLCLSSAVWLGFGLTIGLAIGFGSIRPFGFLKFVCSI